MIAQIGLSILLGGILIYAWTEWPRAPAIGSVAMLATAAGLYFVWLPSHASWLAAEVGIGRGVDLVLYIWVIISLLVMLNLHLKLRSQMELITVLVRNIAIAEARSTDGEQAPAYALSAYRRLPTKKAALQAVQGRQGSRARRSKRGGEILAG